MHPLVSGGPLKHRYRLEQLHFHWLSEHAVNGIKYPMEIHFVHVRADLTVNQALHRKDGLAIISVFGNVQSELEDSDLHMSEVMTHVPKLMRAGNRLSGVLLDMTKLLNVDKSSYYTYAGSLTSPDCNEAVTWIIFTSPIFLTDAQYRMFANIGIVRHNFRSLQRVNQQVVYMPVETKVKVPQIVQFFVDVGKAVTDFFKNFGTFMANGIHGR
ncbi:putative carbonic anhydrase 5 [Spodoptera litura]|uniref:Carbonic anhydrase n=1 Tax=Spodoptera litura TaxID=69820 RepID=A0A9J7J2P5_SPOLT|nr:putative carbonic anhydrase 5 [Spodoptera litura]